MLSGYARLATDDQDLSLQRDALTEVSCGRTFTDTMRGAMDERPGLAAVLDRCLAGDTLVVWRLDRLSHSLTNLIQEDRSGPITFVAYPQRLSRVDGGSARGAPL